MQEVLLKIKEQLLETTRSLQELENVLFKLYEEHPGIFPKSPKEMSASDKMRLARSISDLFIRSN